MYFYYMIAAMGPKYQKYIWWKKYLTTFQMVVKNVAFVGEISKGSPLTCRFNSWPFSPTSSSFCSANVITPRASWSGSDCTALCSCSCSPTFTKRNISTQLDVAGRRSRPMAMPTARLRMGTASILERVTP